MRIVRRSTVRDELLKGVCTTLAEVDEYDNAWFVLQDEAGQFTGGWKAGLNGKFDRMFERMQQGQPPRCCRDVLKRGGLTATDNPEACSDCPLSPDESGLGALTARVDHEGRIYGVLTVTVPIRLTASDEDRRLISEIAALVGWALSGIETAERAERARRDLGMVQSIVHNSPCVLYRTRFAPDEQVEYVSDNIRRFDLDPDDFRTGALQFESLVHPDDIGDAEQAFIEALEAGREHVKLRYRIRSTSGRTFRVEDHIAIERAPDGSPSACTGVLVDFAKPRRKKR
jgi:PAS domain-containing protein